MELSALRHRPAFGVQLRSRRRGLILHRHDHLPLFIRTLPETIASATGQRKHERQDSDNTHDLIFRKLYRTGRVCQMKSRRHFRTAARRALKCMAMKLPLPGEES
jgi:hypothetical protein